MLAGSVLQALLCFAAVGSVSAHAVHRHEYDNIETADQFRFAPESALEPTSELVSDVELLTTFLDSLEKDILPLTTKGIEHGGGVYGAGIYDKTNLSTLAIGTNQWTKSPLIHGETDAIRAFFEIPAEQRPRTKDTYFFTTHEPCPLCLSAITWSGFDNFYVFWTYQESEDLFDEPYHRLIEEAVWKLRAEGESDEAYARRPLYARENRFWKARFVKQMVEELEEGEDKVRLSKQVKRIKGAYRTLWKRYQEIPKPPGTGKPDE